MRHKILQKTLKIIPKNPFFYSATKNGFNKIKIVHNKKEKKIKTLGGKKCQKDTRKRTK